MMMGVWLATSFIGNFLAGYLGSFWTGMDKGSFFLMIAAIAALAGLAILAFVRPLEADPQELERVSYRSCGAPRDDELYSSAVPRYLPLEALELDGRNAFAN